MPEFTREIVVHEDGTASLETKIIDAAAMFPEQGELFVLPPNCRFHRSEEGVTALVVEEAPRVRTITWRTDTPTYRSMRERLRVSGFHRVLGMDVAAFDECLRVQTTFELAFPYVVKCYQFRGDVFMVANLWFRAAVIEDERSDLSYANLPNTEGSSGRICIPREYRGRGISEMVTEIEQDFWSSPWNDHLTERFFETARRIPEVASPWEWEYHSRRDPAFVLSLPWQSAERTVGEEVGFLLGGVAAADRAKIFDFFAGRVRTAPHYDPDAPAAAPAPKQEQAAVARPPAPREITVAGERFDDQSLIVFTDTNIWPYRTSPFYVVSAVHGGADGSVMAKFEGEEYFTPLGRAGGLFPGVQFLHEERDEHGYLRADGFRLRDGTELRRGEWVLAALSGFPEKTLVEIAAFLPVGRNRETHALLTTTGHEVAFETAQGALDPNTVEKLPVFAVSASRAKFGSERWRARGYWFDQETGRSRRPVRFESSKPGAIEVVFSDGTRRLLVAGWKKVGTVEPVRSGIASGTDILYRGMRIRLREAVKDVPAGKRFVVSHAIPAKDGKPGMVVLTNGLGFDLTAGNATLFDVRMRNAWRPLAVPVGVLFAEVEVERAGEGLEVGVRVRYTGSDGNHQIGSYEYEKDAKTVFAVILEKAGFNGCLCHGWKVRFNRGLGHDAKREFNLGAANLALLGTKSIKDLGFDHVFYRRAAGVRGMCVNFGAVAGEDTDGREIKIGDRVKSMSFFSDARTEMSRLFADAGHVFTVVHVLRRSGFAYLYLHAGEDVGWTREQGMAILDNGKSIPERLRNDPSWWSCLSVTDTHRCEVVP